MFKQYADSILSKLPQGRLLSLDVFRGLTIAAMVLVNNPGSWSYVYAPLKHAVWHGYTPTDLIFPFFVFIVGISIFIVVERELKKCTSKSALLKAGLVRAAKLFALGIFIALFFYDFIAPSYSWLSSELQQVRFLGVLQRLALVYMATLVIVLLYKPADLWKWFWGLLIGYAIALNYVPYTNGEGDWIHGRLEHGNNLAAWLDNFIIASNHLYYSNAEPFAFDPEGLLSTLPAIASCLAGVFTGQLITSTKLTLKYKVKLLTISALALLVLGHLWGLFLPINKALWTSSYVLVSTGWALVLLAVLTWLLDVKGYKRWSAPFVVFGANAIFFYVFSALVARLLIMIPVGNTSLHGLLYFKYFQPAFGYHLGSLMFALTFSLLSYFLMHWLYKRQIFFKV